jgi:predicted nucleic acid-binding protein
MHPGTSSWRRRSPRKISFGLARLGPSTKRRRLLEGEYRRLSELVRWADWSEAAAWQFGIFKARLFARGRVIDDFDIAIGSIAVQLGARLATHNARHFLGIEEIDVDDWGPPLG